MKDETVSGKGGSPVETVPASELDRNQELKSLESYRESTKHAYKVLTGEDIEHVNCPPWCAIQDAAITHRAEHDVLASRVKMLETIVQSERNMCERDPTGCRRHTASEEEAIIALDMGEKVEGS